jgi:hypothetical protein
MQANVMKINLSVSVQLFCKYGINLYLQPLNQPTNQPINDICSYSNRQGEVMALRSQIRRSQIQENIVSHSIILFFLGTLLMIPGVHFRPVKNWLFQLGFAYDTSPVDSNDPTPDMPMDRQIRYVTGIQYKWRDRLSIGGDPIVA